MSLADIFDLAVLLLIMYGLPVGVVILIVWVVARVLIRWRRRQFLLSMRDYARTCRRNDYV